MGKFSSLRKDLNRYADKEKAAVLSRFFKTGPGEYGEGDIFLGVVVPKIRHVAKRHYADATLADVHRLVRSGMHEERLLGLLILVLQFDRSEEAGREKMYRFYLANTRSINNWDLVDLTAEKIIGAFLYGKDASILYDLAVSKNIWERRIAIMSTFYFIKKGDFAHTFAIAKMLLDDKHDLIHKATGWMLREVGKRIAIDKEETFLRKYYKIMPRTMLRYAIERFPESKRMAYLGGTVR